MQEAIRVRSKHDILDEISAVIHFAEREVDAGNVQVTKYEFIRLLNLLTDVLLSD